MNAKQLSKTKVSIIGIISFALLMLLDQVTKIAAVNTLKDKEPIVIIKGVFQLQYLENRGAAFSLLEGRGLFFIIVAIIVSAILVYIYIAIPYVSKFNWIRVICVLIVSGALGNVIDRISHVYVVDFFYFCLINFPIFNVADIYVTGAAVTLVIVVLFIYKDEDLNVLKKALLRK